MAKWDSLVRNLKPKAKFKFLCEHNWILVSARVGTGGNKYSYKCSKCDQYVEQHADNITSIKNWIPKV